MDIHHQRPRRRRQSAQSLRVDSLRATRGRHCDERPAPATQFFKDSTASIIATNDSPDIAFNASINPYRGCEHGCVYCYARPYHEYLGFSAGLDFETKIMVKEDAPELLRRELNSPKWQPQVLGVSGVTDAYQPIERRLQITRRCLEVLAEFRNPVWIVTKNRLVTRDLDHSARAGGPSGGRRRHRGDDAGCRPGATSWSRARRRRPAASTRSAT